MNKKKIYYKNIPVEIEVELDEATKRQQLTEKGLVYLSAQINAILFEIQRKKGTITEGATKTSVKSNIPSSEPTILPKGPMKEGTEKKGGVNEAPITPKQNIAPPAQKSENTPKWTDEQKNAIKNIASQLKITKNEEFNPFVISWSLGYKTSYKDLTQDNIMDFIEYLKKEYSI